MLGRRGRTRPDRLARLDAWLVDAERDLLAAPAFAGLPVVDLGLGDTPESTAALATALAPLGVAVVGVDHDEARVAWARRCRPDLRFEVGGFDVPVPARLIRAMNVLRGYPPGDVPAAHAAMVAALPVGGLLVEGSSDTEGHVLVAHLIRRTPSGAVREGLWLSTDGERGFAPAMLRDMLPRDLRRAVSPGTALHDLFARWTSAWEEVRAEGVREARAAFVASVGRLDDVDARWAEEGHAVWRPVGGVPCPS